MILWHTAESRQVCLHSSRLETFPGVWSLYTSPALVSHSTLTPTWTHVRSIVVEVVVLSVVLVFAVVVVRAVRATVVVVVAGVIVLVVVVDVVVVVVDVVVVVTTNCIAIALLLRLTRVHAVLK